MAQRLPMFLLLVLVASLVGCDHATKSLAVSHLAGGTPVELIPGALDLHLAHNTDVGFGLLRWIPDNIRQPLLLVFGFGMVGFLSALLYRQRAHRLEAMSYALFLAGALGNVSDRAIRGHVVDFIHIHHWPVFNVADICLVVGAGLLLLSHYRGQHGAAPPHAG